jgi:ABC-type nitrate/sulfonate/bicarbonate transport system substrate-binding protein
VVLDLEDFYRSRGAWPPGKVIVATKQTVEQRGEELGALLRANVRAFWFMEDPRNFDYMYDLDTRSRQATFNEDERRLRIYRDAPRANQRPGPNTMDGLVPRAALADVVEQMMQAGDLERPIDLDDVLKDQASIDACNQLLERGVIDREELERWRSVRGAKLA